MFWCISAVTNTCKACCGATAVLYSKCLSEKYGRCPLKDVKQTNNE